MMKPFKPNHYRARLINCDWWTEDDVVRQFETVDAALVAINEFIGDTASAKARGFLDAPYTMRDIELVACDLHGRELFNVALPRS